MALHPEVQTLATLLREIEELLTAHGQSHWAGQVASCREIIERSDAYGLHRFLSAFGGMGSLSDAVLDQSGTALAVENERLRRLRSRAWELANKLAREEPG